MVVKNQRKWKRHDLQIQISVPVLKVIITKEKYIVDLNNLGRGGFEIKYNPGEHNFGVGNIVQIKLPTKSWVMGRIVWINEKKGVAGIRIENIANKDNK